MAKLWFLRALLRTAVGLVVLGIVVPAPASLPTLVLKPSTQTRLDLTATGHIGGLQPGHVARLVLTIRNGGDVRAVVRRLSILPSQAQSGCRIVVADWTGMISVAAKAGATQAVPVQVVGSGCGDKTWTLYYLAQS